MLHTHRLTLPSTLDRTRALSFARAGYDLDGFAIEYDDETCSVDFRLELGQGLGIFSALPAGPNDRLRCFLVDGAAFYVDEPELKDDPLVFDSPRLVWAGVLAEYPRDRALTKVIFESSLAAGAYRFEAHVTHRPTDTTNITILTWASSSPPLPLNDDGDVDDANSPASPVARCRELMRAVYARPRDEELRVVCVDALLEMGDPRGQPSSFEDDAFLSENRARLLGGLANTVFIDEVRFRHGFIDRLILRRPNKTPFFHVDDGQRVVSAATEAKELATARALELIDLPVDEEWVMNDAAHRVVARLPQSNMQGLCEIVCRAEQLARSFDHPEQAEVGEWLREHITRLVVSIQSTEEASVARADAARHFPRLTLLAQEGSEQRKRLVFASPQ